MAGFRQHVAVSTALGVGYGAAAYFGAGIEPMACVVASGLTALGGMLPDLDAPTGQPVREVLGFAAAVTPLLFLRRLGLGMTCLCDTLAEGRGEVSSEAMVVVMMACYLGVRFGGAWLLDLLTVHRGMFHSIPAGLVVALAAFLAWDAPAGTRLLLAAGSLLGFLSHLVMDEIWSVRWGTGQPLLKKSAGSALKFFSGSVPATAGTYAVLLGLSYLVVRDPALGPALRGLRQHPTVERITGALPDVVRR